jgi:carbamoyl-phosphate synthase large subunit
MANNTIKDFRVLVTASGLSPVGFNTIFSLKGKVKKIIGVDVKPESYVKQICDNYYMVPLANNKKYVQTITDICLKEDIDTILPLTIEETLVFKKGEKELNGKGIFIANNNSIKNIEICNDKFLTNQYLKNHGLSVPNASTVSNGDELIQVALSLGYPKKDVIFKPRITHGSRGFRILTRSYDKLGLLLNNKPTDNIFLSLEELKIIIGKNEIRCVVMDKLDGDDYSVYSFALDGKPLIVIPMQRSGLVPGMSTGGQVINNKEIIEYVSRIISVFKFNGSINVQLKLTKDGPLLYEINSRLSATTVMVRPFGLNFPFYEIMLAHGEYDAIRYEISKADIKWGLKMSRIHQEIYNDNGNYFLL